MKEDELGVSLSDHWNVFFSHNLFVIINFFLRLAILIINTFNNLQVANFSRDGLLET